MEAMMLAIMLSCSDGAWILGGLNDPNGPVMPLEDKIDIRDTIIAQMPDNCKPDQYNPEGRRLR